MHSKLKACQTTWQAATVLELPPRTWVFYFHIFLAAFVCQNNVNAVEVVSISPKIGRSELISWNRVSSSESYSCCWCARRCCPVCHNHDVDSASGHKLRPYDLPLEHGADLARMKTKSPRAEALNARKYVTPKLLNGSSWVCPSRRETRRCASAREGSRHGSGERHCTHRWLGSQDEQWYRIL